MPGRQRARWMLGTHGAGLALVLGTHAVQAQVTGLPLSGGGIMRGFTLASEVGFPTQDYGGGTAYGLRGSLGIGRLGLAGVISRYNVDDPFPNQTGVGASMSLRLTGRPVLGPGVTLQGSAEYFGLQTGSKLHFPINLGLGVGLPAHRFVIRPWVAPRIDIFRNSFDDPAHTDTNFGLSGGLTVMGRRGFGLTFSFDRTFAGDDFNPSTFGIGLQYHFRHSSR